MLSALPWKPLRKGLIKEKIPWGDYKAARALIEDIAYRRGLGEVLAEGVRFAAEKIGGTHALGYAC
jgi:aldehyde:ferredoxin oxidoreductase